MLQADLPSTNQKVGSSSLFRRAIENGYHLGIRFLFTTAAQSKRIEGECAKRGARSRSERRQKRSGGAFLTRAQMKLMAVNTPHQAR